MKRLGGPLALLAVAGCTCDPAAVNGTALRVRVNIDDALSVTQLRFSATHGGTGLFTPVVRPETAGDSLMSGGSLLALLSDALDGEEVSCTVEGLKDGVTVTSDTKTATVKKGVEVPCTVQLFPPRVCDATTCAGCCAGDTCLAGGEHDRCGSGGEVCAACAAGQRCVSGACLCDAASCDGCCSGVQCLDGGSDALACGRGGAACASCPAPQACTGGACTCDGGPCGMGCSATTCPTGCCSAGTCVANTPGTCGAAGVACFDCKSTVSDNCGPNDTCRCGTRAGPCPATKHCVNGDCVCDGTVCAGCCRANGNCDTGTTVQRCGVDGGTCRSCNNACVAGVCQ